jgi:hypothetical protein
MKSTWGQISELICKHSQKEKGLHEMLEIMIESMMVAALNTFTSAFFEAFSLFLGGNSPK